MDSQKSLVVAVIIILVAGFGVWYFSSQSVNNVPPTTDLSDSTVDISNDLNQIQDNSAALDAEAKDLGQQIDSL